MINAEKQFTQADREQIAQRIAELETHTDAEVVCAVATESGRYDRAESVCGLLIGVATLILAQQWDSPGDWNAPPALSIGGQVLLIAVGFLVGSLAASYWHGLRRLFVTRDEMQTEVHRRVHQVFSQQGIGNTRHNGGLLIYVSLFEHRLEIHCDSAAAGKLTPENLATIRDAVLGSIKSGHFTAGLLAGLDAAEPILAAALPHTDHGLDTLQNDLLVFHHRP